MKAVLMVIVACLAAAAATCAADDVEFPEAMKGVVPVYTGAKTVLAMKMENGAQAHLESDAKSRDILDFYRKSMKEKGWEVAMDMALPEGGTVVFSKGKESLNVLVSASEGKSRVVLVLGREE